MTVKQAQQKMPTDEERRQGQGFEPFEKGGEWHGDAASSTIETPRKFIPDNGQHLARGLGWFSICLGLAEVFAPHAIEKFLGIRHRSLLIRFMGLREIASGIGILSQGRPAPWLWARVGGDAVDLAGLGMALSSPTAHSGNVSAAILAVGGVTALDVCCAQELSRRNDTDAGKAFTVRKSIQINRSAEEIYRFWRNFESLPRFMSSLESVRSTSDRHSHWIAVDPAGKRIEWDAEIVLEQDNRLIEWRTLEGSDVQHSGSVRFEAASGGRGTFIKLQIEYSPPGGSLGATIAKLLGRSPEQQAQEDLHRLKALMETGEIVTTKGQPSGRASSTSWKYDQTIRRAPDAASTHQGSTV